MWETVAVTDHDPVPVVAETERLRVQGGWVVRTIVRSRSWDETISVASDSVFVPDPSHEWRLTEEG